MYLAKNGVEGLEETQKINPDLILMDMHMPLMDGLETTSKIRELPDFKDTPIVAVSADAFTEQQKKAFDAGVNEYITKPIDFDKLLPIMVKYLKKEGVAAVENSVQNGHKVLSEEDIKEIENKLQQIEQTPIFETKQIVGFVNEIRRISENTNSPYPELCDKIEDVVFAGDEEMLKELLEKVG